MPCFCSRRLFPSLGAGALELVSHRAWEARALVLDDDEGGGVGSHVSKEGVPECEAGEPKKIRYLERH